MIFRERVELGALEVEHADAAILQEQRDDQLRLRVVDDFYVARIGRDVLHQHRLLVQRRVADEADAKLHARHQHLVAVPHRDLHLQLAGLVVDEQDAERAVVDDAPGQVRDPREELVEVENRAEFARDLRERLERARVLALVLEETRVLDRDGDVRRELPQHRLVGFRELADGVAQQVQRADDASLAAKRHDQLRLRSGHGVVIARVGAHVVDENRLSFGDRRADETVADRHPERARRLLRIADGIRDRELVLLRIQQIDGERLELGEPGDELRDLLQQLLEVKDRRDLASEREERRQLVGGSGRGGHHNRVIG